MSRQLGYTPTPADPLNLILSRSLRRRALAACPALAGALLLVTCAGEPVAPGVPRVGQISIAPIWPDASRLGGLVLDNVRLTVVRPPSDTITQVVRNFPPATTQLQLTASIILQGLSENLQVTLELFSGTTLLFSGTQTIGVGAGAGGSPIQLPVTFSGPGAQVATLALQPRDTTIGAGSQLAFSVTAQDSQAAPVAQFYTSWSSSDPAVTIDGAGVATAGGGRSTVTITASTPSGARDSTTLTVVPPATQIVKVSGDNQTAGTLVRLPLPLVVEVRAADNLPVAGVPVTFAVLSGGGSVDSATATTDLSGRASTGATLGGTVGAQSFTAAASGANSVTFSATATGSGGANAWTGGVSTDWSTAGNWSGGAVPTNADDVVIPSGPANQPAITASCAAKSLTVNLGAVLSLGAFNCQVGGNVLADGPIVGSGSVQIATTAQIRGTVPNLILSGPVTAVGPMLVAGNITISNGDFIVGGQLVQVSGSLTTQGTGLLSMTNTSDSLVVLGAGIFGGGDESTRLTAGDLKIGGSFSQTSATSAASFAASGTHRTEMGSGGVRVINFANPGAATGSSHFNTLIVNGAAGGISLAANTFVNGQLISHPTGATPVIGVTAGPKVLTVGGVDIVALGVDQNVMTIGAGTITAFDGVSFTGQAPTAPALTITNAGTAGGYTFNGVSFAVTPTSGFYLVANDLDGPTPDPLTVNMVSPTPATPGGFTSATNGAVINWPFTGSLKTWTGAQTSDWNTTSNWSPVGIPTAADDVIIPLVANQPSLSGNGATRNLTVQSGVVVLVNGFTVTIAGDLASAASNPFSGGGTLALIGTTRTVTGALGAGISVDVSGSYTMTGRTTAGGLTVSGTGGLTIGGQTLSLGGALVATGSGILTMTNPLDSILLGGAGIFGGGSTAGTLTAGYLKIGGSFTQTSGTSVTSFAASGSHTTELGSAAVRVVNFASPAATSSHFNNLIVTGATGGLSLATNTFVNGQLIAHPTGGTPLIGVTAGAKVLTVGGVDVSRLAIDQNVMTIGAGALTQFDTVSFTGQANGVTQLTISNPGSPSPATFTGLSFAVTPVGGLYLAATDADGATPNALTINLVSATPAAPSPSLFSASNGAVINWPPTGSSITWLGTISTDWFQGSNWVGAKPPGASDSVIIPAGTTFSPALSNGAVVAAITLQPSALLDLGAFVLVVTGTVDNGGLISSVTNGGLALAGTGAQLRGAFNTDVQISGTYTMNGAVTAGNFSIANGNLALAGRSLSVSTFSTLGTGIVQMTSPLDSLLVGTVAVFQGGSTVGSLTDGALSIGGDFLQDATNSTTSFAPSGKHKTVLTARGAASIVFFSPGFGSAGSHFQVLDVTQAIGGYTLNVNTIADSLISASAAVTLSGNGNSLTVRRAQVSGLTLDNAPLILDEQGAFSTENFSNVTFQGFPTSGTTMLKVLGPGSSLTARPVVTTSNVNFQSLGAGAGNFYVDLTSTNGAAFNMTMTGSNQSPLPPVNGNGPTLTKTAGGATVSWP